MINPKVLSFGIGQQISFTDFEGVCSRLEPVHINILTGLVNEKIKKCNGMPAYALPRQS
jgi:hypothetical protein